MSRKYKFNDQEKLYFVNPAFAIKGQSDINMNLFKLLEAAYKGVTP